MSGDILAKFIGNQEDERTKIMGIRVGQKYLVNLKNAGLMHKIHFGLNVNFIAEIITKKGKFGIPYESKHAFLNNWKVKKI